MADITEVKRKDGKILKVGTKVNLTGKSEHGETGADVWEKNPEDNATITKFFASAGINPTIHAGFDNEDFGQWDVDDSDMIILK